MKTNVTNATLAGWATAALVAMVLLIWTQSDRASVESLSKHVDELEEVVASKDIKIAEMKASAKSTAVSADLGKLQEAEAALRERAAALQKREQSHKEKMTAEVGLLAEWKDDLDGWEEDLLEAQKEMEEWEVDLMGYNVRLAAWADSLNAKDERRALAAREADFRANLLRQAEQSRPPRTGIPRLSAGTVVNPDGSHSVYQSNGAGGALMVHPDGSHSTVLDTGANAGIVINPDGSHSLFMDTHP